MKLETDPAAIRETIRDEIVVGRLTHEDRLDGRALAQRFGADVAGATTAMKQLTDGGLLVEESDDTFAVRRWARRDAEDLFAIRRMYEGLAARLCATRASTAEIDAVIAANQVFLRTLADGDIPGNVRADLAFHEAIVRGADCIELTRLLRHNPAIGCSMVVLGKSLEEPVDRVMGAHVRTCHDPIIEALRTGDGAGAERAAHHHVDVASKRAFGDAP